MDSERWKGRDDPTSLKTRLTAEFNSKLAKAQDLYEQRLQEVREQANAFRASVQTDEVINTMKQNSVSQQFVDFRVRELQEESMAKERELTIQQLQTEVMELTGRLARTDIEGKQLAKALNEAEEGGRKALLRADQLERQLHEVQQRTDDVLKRRELELAQKLEGAGHLKRTSEQMADLEQQLRTAVRQTDSLRIDLDRERARAQAVDKENHSLQLQLSESQEEVQDLVMRLQSVQAEKGNAKAESERLRDRMAKEGEELQAKLSRYEEEITEALKQESRSKESLQAQYVSKSKLFKRKIIEQKDYIADLSQELQQSQELQEELKRQLDRVMRSAQDDIRRVKEEWERKVAETEREGQRKEVELNSKHQAQMAQLQTAMEQRIAEVQTDTQTQVAKAKFYDQEMKGVFEERIKSIERDYILIAKHEAGMKELGLRLKTEHETALTQIRDTLETQVNQLTRDLKTLKDDLGRKTREIDTSKNRASEAEKELTQLQDTCSQLRDQNRKAEAYISELTEKQHALVAHLEAASENLQKLKTLCEDESRKRQAAENESKRIISDLREIQSQLQDSQRQNVRLQDKIRSTEEETAGVMQDNREMKEALAHTQTEGKQLDRDVNDLKVRLEKALAGRKEESQRYERELASHMDTRNRLLQAESKTKALGGELQDYERRCGELKAALKRVEEEKSDLQQRLFRCESLLSSSASTKSELHARLDKARLALSDSKLRLRKMIGNRLSVLQSDLLSLRSAVESAVTLSRKDLASDLQGLLYRLHDQGAYSKSKWEQRLRQAVEDTEKNWALRLREVENQQKLEGERQTQEAGEQLERQLEAYRGSIAQLKRDQRTAIDEIDRLKRENASLQQDNQKYQTKLKQNSQAFDELERDIFQKAAEIKQESDLMLEKSRRELVRKYETEVRSLTKSLEEIKAGKLADSQRFEAVLSALREKLAEETKTLRLEYEGRLKAIGRELEAERESSGRLKEEMDRLNAETANLEREHEVALKQFEQQMSDMELRATQQASVHMETHDETDRLSKRLREVTKDLAVKSEQLTALQRDKDRQKTLILELQKQVDDQSADLASMRTAKDKEIEYLKTLLNKTFTVPVGEIQRSNELQQESLELMERVRKPKKELSSK